MQKSNAKSKECVLELDDFATSLDAQSDLKITARSATGASVEFKSRLSDAPLSIEGRASLKEFNLTTLEPYYADLVGFEVERGQFSGNFNFRVELQPAPGLISVSRGKVQVTDLRALQLGELAGRQVDNEFLKIAEIEASGISWEFPGNKLFVNRIDIVDTQTTVWREKGGNVSVTQLLIPADITDEAGKADPTEDEASKAQATAQAQADSSRGLSPFSFEIGTVSYRDGQITWKEDPDEPERVLQIGVPSIEVQNFSSQNDQPIYVEALYYLGDEGSVKVKGEIVRNGFAVDLNLTADSVPLAAKRQFFAEPKRLVLNGGALNFEGTLRGGRDSDLTLEGDGTVDQLDGAIRGNPDFFLQAKHVDLDGLNWELFDDFLHVESIRLVEPVAKIVLIPTKQAPTPEETLRENTGRFSIARLTVENGHVRYHNSELTEAEPLVIDDLKAVLRDLSFEDRKPANGELSGEFAGGTVSLSGEAEFSRGLGPFSINLQAEGIDLDRLVPYFYSRPAAPALRLTRGIFSYDGELSCDREWSFAAAGDTTLRNYAFEWKPASNLDLTVEGRSIGIFESSYVQDKDRLDLGLIELSHPVVRLTRRSAGEGADLAASEESQSNASRGNAFAVALQRANIEEGELIWVDQSLESLVELPFTQVSIRLADWHIGQETPPPSLRVAAAMPGGELRLHGSLDPLDPRRATDLEFAVQGLALTSLSPYAHSGLGRAILSGTASMAGEWTIRAGQLEASNRVILRGLELGEGEDDGKSRFFSPNLMVSLLRGVSGEIDFMLPISGDLSQPRTHILPVVRSAVTGYFTDLAASPFRVVGNLLGFDEDLEAVDFEPGDFHLPANMRGRVEVIGELLIKRPTVSLNITPEVSPADFRALAASTEGRWVAADDLGRARVEAAKRHLVELHGIDKRRIEIQGFREVEGARQGLRFQLFSSSNQEINE